MQLWHHQAEPGHPRLGTHQGEYWERKCLVPGQSAHVKGDTCPPDPQNVEGSHHGHHMLESNGPNFQLHNKDPSKHACESLMSIHQVQDEMGPSTPQTWRAHI